MSNNIEVIYSPDTMKRARIIFDWEPLIAPWEDNDGWVSLIVSADYRSGYVKAGDADTQFAQTVTHALDTFGPESAARFLRIFYGVPAGIVFINTWRTLVTLDPERCEKSGAPITQETLDAEVEAYTSWDDGDVYGVIVDELEPTTYTVEHDVDGGKAVATFADADKANDYASDFTNATINAIHGAWNEVDACWNFIGMDAAREYANHETSN